MRTFLSLLLCLAAFIAEAQTYYYAHTKTVYADGRTVVQNGESGQFVCRTREHGSYRCYDCTKGGRSHLNGNLYFVDTKNGNEVFKGPSYFGENTAYVFNDARGILNIKDSNGNTYVYKRATPPAGRTRSSLLKPGAPEDGWSVYDNPLPVYTPDPTPSSTSSSDRSRKSSETKSSTSDRTCGTCHGGGRVRAHVGVSGFGVNNDKKKCGTCGEWYYTSTDHWHTCPTCKGTGRR